MSRQIVIGVLVVILILLVCMMWRIPAAEGMTLHYDEYKRILGQLPPRESMAVTHSNHGPYEYDTRVNNQYIRAVDPLMLRPLVNPLIGIAPINPIADVSGFSGF